MAADYIDGLIADMQHEIDNRPIAKPTPGQYADICPYSRTGYAVHEANGACTCRPCEAASTSL